ncbi:MAG: hypothetical protein JSR72_21315 [Proteobacteria bacterium]|nr:hypothetical protein [Pseudomonadota bacterium]
MSSGSPNQPFDLDMLLHPANAFAHPADVVRDGDMSLNEKRAILAAWASDACAVEAAPELRVNGGGHAVRFDDIMDALRELDRQAADAHVDVEALRRASRRRRRRHGSRGGNSGPVHLI